MIMEGLSVEGLLRKFPMLKLNDWVVNLDMITDLETLHANHAIPSEMRHQIEIYAKENRLSLPREDELQAAIFGLKLLRR